MKKTVSKRSFTEIKWYISAVLIFLLFPLGIIFSAVSLALEIKNFKTNKAIIRSAVALTLISAFMLVVTVILSLDTPGTPEMFAMMYSPGVVGGLLLILIYRLLNIRIKRINKIKFLVVDERITGISELSEIMGIREEKITKALNLMFKNKLLDEAYIDENNIIRFRKSLRKREKAVCRTCGAEITVEFGHTLICEYCGGILDVDIIKFAKEN